MEERAARTRFRLQARGTFVYSPGMSSLPLRNRIAFLVASLFFLLTSWSTAGAQDVVNVHVEAMEGAGGDDVGEMVTSALQEDARVQIVDEG